MSRLIPFNRRKNLLSDSGLDFYNMIDDFFSDNWPESRGGTQATFRIDVKENEEGYVIDAELPGVEKNEISISLEENFLTIAVNREENVNEKKDNYIHRERRLSSMSRGVRLVDSKPDGIKAKLANGVLTISVEKQDKLSAVRKIEIE